MKSACYGDGGGNSVVDSSGGGTTLVRDILLGLIVFPPKLTIRSSLSLVISYYKDGLSLMITAFSRQFVYLWGEGGNLQ